MSASALQMKVASKLDNKKRKSIEQKFNHSDLVQTNDEPQAISFNVSSETDNTKNYIVNLINGSDGLQFECNCGDQWNISPKRNNCKHVGGLVGNIVKTFVGTHIATKQQKTKAEDNAKHIDMDDMSMSEVIEEFGKMMSKFYNYNFLIRFYIHI